VAPELYKNAEDLTGFCPKKADMFSLGVIMFMLYFGSPPFNEASDNCKFYKFWKKRGS
jgi:serine/threonine protein kinase